MVRVDLDPDLHDHGFGLCGIKPLALKVQYRLNSVNSAAGEIPRRYCCFCLFGKGALVCRFLLLAWMPLAILALWAVVSANAWVPPLLLPTPWAVLTRGWVLITSGELLHHVWVSCLRVLGGFTLSATLAMVMAFWTHQSEKADLSWRVDSTARAHPTFDFVAGDC